MRFIFDFYIAYFYTPEWNIMSLLTHTIQSYYKYILHCYIVAKCHTIAISSNTLTIVISFTSVSPRELFVLLLLYFAVFDDVVKLSERMFHYFYCHKRIDDEGAV